MPTADAAITPAIWPRVAWSGPTATRRFASSLSCSTAAFGGAISMASAWTGAIAADAIVAVVTTAIVAFKGERMF